MLARVDDVGATSDHGNRASASLERATMRGTVDAERETTHHDEAGLRERPTEVSRHAEPVRGRIACADDGDRRRIECTGLARERSAQVEDRRWIVDVTQCARKALVTTTDRDLCGPGP